ncbi:MAG: DMT family transporter [Bifidobacteriaceae bacterium]|nr:DMT family transporter [Bifidobacteriaceae bacterium]
MASISARTRGNLLLLVAAVMWGLAFTAQRVGAERVDAFTFNAVRFAMGAALVSAVARGLDAARGTSAARRRAMRRAVLWPALACGTLLTAAAGLQQAAMKDTTAGNAAFVTGLYILLVPVFGAFLGKRVRWPTVGGIALGLAGLYLIAITDTFTLARGDGLVMFAAACFAIQILAVDRWVGQLPALRFAAAQFWACAATSALAAPLFDPHPFAGLNLALAPLLYGGLISVGLAYTLQIFGQRAAEPTGAALIMALETVFGALGGALILHENMGLRGYTGAALMCAGIALSELAPGRPAPGHAAVGTPGSGRPGQPSADPRRRP